ncbi:MAG: hypothetical protein ACPGU0_05065, partial [Marinirhabdus sp.]
GTYQFQKLHYSGSYSGSRHQMVAFLRPGKFMVRTLASHLKSKGSSLRSTFSRAYTKASYTLKKAWVGTTFGYEHNQLKNNTSDSLLFPSQRYRYNEVFAGVGDSTKVYVEAGYRHRVNDSLRNAQLNRVNTEGTYYLGSRMLASKTAQLQLFASYRNIHFEEKGLEDEKSLNTRLLYNQNFLRGVVQWNTLVETNNGVVPQQDFTYVKTEAGQGVYTWNDYNNNAIQELDEFEVAQFQDEAAYVRLLLPNRVFVRVRENKLSQLLTLNPKAWSAAKGLKNVLSRFYNQTSYIMDRKVKRDNSLFNINPFKDGGEDQLGVTLSFRNALYFNRGKQRYTANYTYVLNSVENLLVTGLQKSTVKSHQVSFAHKVKKPWLLTLRARAGQNESISENFGARNYLLGTHELNPKVTYLSGPQSRIAMFYQYSHRANTLGGEERLRQQKLGTSFTFAKAAAVSVTGEFNYINNNFSGSPFSPVAYQILEGLQPGTNFTWQLLFQKKITKYLDANLSYFGRKGQTSNTVHTGSVQLRAFF